LSWFFEHWGLEFVWSLGFGALSLVIGI